MSIRRRFGATALALTLAFLLVDAAKLLLGARDAIRWPYDLDYGEGVVWQQMTAIVAGHGYAPLGTFPAIVFHYPPVYHLAVAAVVATGLDPLAAGRLVSLLATLVAMVLAGLLCRAASPVSGDRRAAAIGAAAAGLTVGASPTVLAWASLMRVDLLATSLALAGLCATAAALRRPAHVYLAALLFALAVYTKQTTILAPLAALTTLWLTRRAAAVHFLAASAALSVAALFVLMVLTHGSFLAHVVGANVNRLDLDRSHLIARVLASQAITLAIAALVAGRVVGGWGRDWRTAVAGSPIEATRFLLVLYAALRVVTLPLALKSGANENYMIDLFSVSAVLVGLGVAEVAQTILHGGPWPRPALTLLVLIGLPVQAARAERPHALTHDATLAAADAALVARIRAARGPVLTDYMVLVRRAGRPVLIEPAIVAELGHAGRYDEAGLVRLIRARRFAFVLTQGADHDYRERYNPAVRAAIEAAYPQVEPHGEALLRLTPQGRAASPPS